MAKQPPKGKEQSEADRRFARIESDAERTYRVYRRTSVESLRRVAGPMYDEPEEEHPA